MYLKYNVFLNKEYIGKRYVETIFENGNKINKDKISTIHFEETNEIIVDKNNVKYVFNTFICFTIWII